MFAPFGLCFAEGAAETTPPPSESEKQFLDRLMAAESGGRLSANNPATSARGPFQFLAATFLDVVQRNFPQLVAGKPAAEILNLRADPEVSRLAALIYTRENAHFLAAHGTAVTAANLRLAFFAGPLGAVKVLAAKPEEPVPNILSAAAVEANPFLTHMTAGALIEWATRQAESVGTQFSVAAARGAQGSMPAIAVQLQFETGELPEMASPRPKTQGDREASASLRGRQHHRQLRG